jgi:hypothetical protein
VVEVVVREPTNQPLGWYPPIAVGDERLQCAYCDWSCPRWYQNRTGPKAPLPGRDGNTRLTTHIDAEHYVQHRKALKAARDRLRYAAKKAARQDA